MDFKARPRLFENRRAAVVIGLHAAFAILLVVVSVALLVAGPSAPGPGDLPRRPDDLFDGLDSWIRGFLALCGIAAALVIVAGAVLWLRRGRRTFGIAMDVAIGLAAFVGLASGDHLWRIAVLLVGLASAAVLLASRSRYPDLG